MTSSSVSSFGLFGRQAATRVPRPAAQAPELPRVRLDTRMPPAPAPGGRIIVVGPPTKRSAIGDAPAIAMVGVILLLLAAVLRWRGAVPAWRSGRRR
jgi:hypothetical protein